jgi:hypothetical protein
MGVDAVAMLSLSVQPISVYDIADRLTANVRLTEQMMRYLDELDSWVAGRPISALPARNSESHSRKWEPHWIPGKVNEMWCDAPIGTLRLYPELAELFFWCRWRSFLTEPRLRAPLLAAAQLISAELNGGKLRPILFVPDSLYAESSAFEECDSTMPKLLAMMGDRFGPPAPSFESIVQDDGEAMGYFVHEGDRI